MVLQIWLKIVPKARFASLPVISNSRSKLILLASLRRGVKFPDAFEMGERAFQQTDADLLRRKEGIAGGK